jgi:hypothetical protein
MDYLERVGAGGFTIYYYEAGNPQSRRPRSRNAAEEQHRNNAILFPRYRDGHGRPRGRADRALAGGAALLQSLITDYFDKASAGSSSART